MVPPSRYYNEAPFQSRKVITDSNAGGLGEEGTPIPIFDVTGVVLINTLTALVTTIVAEEGATTVMSLGVTGQVALFIADTEPEDLDAGEFWQVIGTGAGTNGDALVAAMKDILVSANIINTVSLAAVTSGVIAYTALWTPLSADGLVAAA